MSNTTAAVRYTDVKFEGLERGPVALVFAEVPEIERVGVVRYAAGRFLEHVELARDAAARYRAELLADGFAPYAVNP